MTDIDDAVEKLHAELIRATELLENVIKLSITAGHWNSNTAGNIARLLSIQAVVTNLISVEVVRIETLQRIDLDQMTPVGSA